MDCAYTSSFIVVNEIPQKFFQCPFFRGPSRRLNLPGAYLSGPSSTSPDWFGRLADAAQPHIHEVVLAPEVHDERHVVEQLPVLPRAGLEVLRRHEVHAEPQPPQQPGEAAVEFVAPTSAAFGHDLQYWMSQLNIDTVVSASLAQVQV